MKKDLGFWRLSPANKEIGAMQVIKQVKKDLGFWRLLPANKEIGAMQVIKQVKHGLTTEKHYLKCIKLAQCR